MHLPPLGHQGCGARGRPPPRRAPAAPSSAKDADGAAVRRSRPSSAPRPASGTLGSVAAKTREAVLLCRSRRFRCGAGGDGGGPASRRPPVADMVDFSGPDVAGGGDPIAGHQERRLVELADAFAINKSDGDNATPGPPPPPTTARAAYSRAALAALVPAGRHLFGAGQPAASDLWTVAAHRHRLTRRASSPRAASYQQVAKWMWSMLEERLFSRLRTDPGDPRQSQGNRGRRRRRTHNAHACRGRTGPASRNR